MGFQISSQRCRIRRGTRTSHTHGSPDAGASTSPSGCGGASEGGPSSNEVVHEEIRCAETRLQHELSLMPISDDGLETRKRISGQLVGWSSRISGEVNYKW